MIQIQKRKKTTLGALAFATALGTSAALGGTAHANSFTQGSTVQLNGPVKVYGSADAARTGSGRAVTYNAGQYSVYKVHKEFVNITKTPGKPGGWIKASSLPVAQPKPQPKPQPQPQPKPQPQSNQSKVKLPRATRAYLSAYNALNRTGTSYNYGAGEYYVFMTHGNAVNITKVPGQPGGWISKADLNGTAQPAPQPAPQPQTINKGRPQFGSNGLLIMKQSARAQQVINLKSQAPGHRNGAAIFARNGVNALIDQLSTEEAIWVLWRLEGRGFGQTGDGYAGQDTPRSHQVFVKNQLDRRFGGSIHNLLKKWGTYSYGGY